MMLKKVFAKNGDRITCTKGHPIATFTREVYYYEVVQTDMFANRHPQIDWRRNAILNGRCPEPECEGIWISDTNGMFIEGEWR
jgi:hypothetical protein